MMDKITETTDDYLQTVWKNFYVHTQVVVFIPCTKINSNTTMPLDFY